VSVCGGSVCVCAVHILAWRHSTHSLTDSPTVLMVVWPFIRYYCDYCDTFLTHDSVSCQPLCICCAGPTVVPNQRTRARESLCVHDWCLWMAVCA
jgi:hypothetical protein